MICSNAADGSLLRRPVTIPTAEEDLQLIIASQKGDIAARNEMIERHLPAIISYASGYYKIRRRPPHIELEDLIQVSVFGVVHAIGKYREEKAKGRFISYAKYWMRNYMEKAIDTYRLFRVPTSTLFAYKTGKLNNPETKAAIDHFRHMGFLTQRDRVYDKQLTPEEAAIFKEECELIKAQPDRSRRSAQQ